MLTSKVNALAGGTRRLGVGGDVGVQLRLLSSDIGTVVGAALCLVDLQSQNLELELEDLVLDLSDLQGISCGAGSSGDGVVEAAGVDLGVLCGCPGGLEDGNVGGCHSGKVGLVYLS